MFIVFDHNINLVRRGIRCLQAVDFFYGFLKKGISGGKNIMIETHFFFNMYTFQKDTYSNWFL